MPSDAGRSGLLAALEEALAILIHPRFGLWQGFRGAFGAAGYDAVVCRGHLATAAGVDCLELGCRARRACPIGRRFAHEPGQARFHMAAFCRS